MAKNITVIDGKNYTEVKNRKAIIPSYLTGAFEKFLTIGKDVKQLSTVEKIQAEVSLASYLAFVPNSEENALAIADAIAEVSAKLNPVVVTEESLKAEVAEIVLNIFKAKKAS